MTSSVVTSDDAAGVLQGLLFGLHGRILTARGAAVRAPAPTPVGWCAASRAVRAAIATRAFAARIVRLRPWPLPHIWTGSTPRSARPSRTASRCRRRATRSGPLLIVAGAGTGKTDTLAHRVAHLVINGVDPARILMLTFTRRAATEMRRRAHEITRKALDDALGGVSQGIAQRLSWSGTFHSIGNRLLRHYAPHVQLDPHFSVIDRGDCRRPHGQPAPGTRAWRPRSSVSRARTPACRSTPTASTRARRLKETLEQHYPWCAQWEADLADAVPRLRRAEAALAACSTTTTCCSTGTR